MHAQAALLITMVERKVVVLGTEKTVRFEVRNKSSLYYNNWYNL